MIPWLLAVSVTAWAAEVRIVAPAAGSALDRDHVELSVEVHGEPLTHYAVVLGPSGDTVVVETDEAGLARHAEWVRLRPRPSRTWRHLEVDLRGPVDGVWGPGPLGRDRVVLLDLRSWAPTEVPLLAADLVLQDGLEVTLTASGLDAMEDPLALEVPAEPLAPLDAVLARRIGAGVPAAASSSDPPVCLPLAEAPPELQAAVAADAAALLAGGTAIVGCKNALDFQAPGAWQAAVAVHGYEWRPGLPSRADLEVCVDRAEASLVELWTWGHGIALESADDAVLAWTTHEWPRGTVDVDLEAWLVYRGDTYSEGPCPLAPAREIPPAESRCEDLPFGATSAAGRAVPVGLAPGEEPAWLAAWQDDVSVTEMRAGWLDVEASTLCGHPVLAPEVEALLPSVAATAAAVLDGAWDEGRPDPTQLSAGLEAVLGSWELDAATDGLVLEAELTSVVERRVDPDDAWAAQGITARYDTWAAPSEISEEPRAPIYAPEVLAGPETGGETWWSTPVDARISVGLGALNQVLAASADAGLLAGQEALDGPGELPLDAGPWVLDWRVTHRPLVDDVAGEEEGEGTLRLEVPDVRVELRRPKGEVLLTLAVDLVDEDLGLGLGAADGALEPELELQLDAVWVLSHRLEGWPDLGGLLDAGWDTLIEIVEPAIAESLALLPIPEFQGLEVAPDEALAWQQAEAPYVEDGLVVFGAWLTHP